MKPFFLINGIPFAVESNISNGVYMHFFAIPRCSFFPRFIAMHLYSIMFSAPAISEEFRGF